MISHFFWTRSPYFRRRNYPIHFSLLKTLKCANSILTIFNELLWPSSQTLVAKIVPGHKLTQIRFRVAFDLCTCIIYYTNVVSFMDLVENFTWQPVSRTRHRTVIMKYSNLIITYYCLSLYGLEGMTRLPTLKTPLHYLSQSSLPISDPVLFIRKRIYPVTNR